MSGSEEAMDSAEFTELIQFVTGIDRSFTATIAQKACGGGQNPDWTLTLLHFSVFKIGTGLKRAPEVIDNTLRPACTNVVI